MSIDPAVGSAVPPAMDAAAPILAAIIDAAMDAIVVLDAAQRIMRFNPAAERLFGCPASAAIGAPLDRFLPERVRARHRRDVAAFAATGDTARAMGHLRPLTARRADGTEFPIEATIARVALDGQPYVAAIVRDITAREAAEAARRAAHAQAAAAQAAVTTAARERDRLQTLLDRMPSGVQLVRAPDGAVGFANVAFRAMLGDSAELANRLPVYGRDFAFQRADGAPLPSDDRPGLRALRGERIANLPLRLDRYDDAPLPVAVHAAPMQIAAEPPAEAIVVLQDVTVLRQAEQLKDDFLALVSHELRTPLTAIHGGTRLLASARDALPGAQRQELLDDVVQESGRLDRLLANLLALADILAGRLPVATEPVLLPPFVRQVATAAQTRHQSHAFVVALPSDLPPSEADPALLEEVLANLYDNAVKYSPAGGEIQTTATADDDRIALTVHDHGVGIAPEHVEQVFERFRRPGAPAASRGMGLGLYLSRLLVEAQGGTIAAASAGPEQGSAFTITLPVADGWTEPDAND